MIWSKGVGGVRLELACYPCLSVSPMHMPHCTCEGEGKGRTDNDPAACSDGRSALCACESGQRVDSLVEEVPFFLAHGGGGGDDHVHRAFGDVCNARRGGKREVEDGRVDGERADSTIISPTLFFTLRREARWKAQNYPSPPLTP